MALNTKSRIPFGLAYDENNCGPIHVVYDGGIFMQEGSCRRLCTAEKALAMGTELKMNKRKAVRWECCEFADINFVEVFMDEAVKHIDLFAFTNCTFTDCIFADMLSQKMIMVINSQFDDCVVKDSSINITIIDCAFDDGELRNVQLQFVNLISNVSFYDTKITNVTCTHAEKVYLINIRVPCYGSINDCDFRNTDAHGIWVSSKVRVTGTKHPFIKKCPDKEFVGYKVARLCNDDVIVKLRIPETAKKIASINGKCRCNEAYVEGVYDIDTGEELNDATAVSTYRMFGSGKVTYTKGAHVISDDFNDEPIIECAAGIHFFLTKEEAIDYVKKH